MEIAVSVIIPVYNRADEIGRCIKSVTEQSLSNIEIIVVNDGSTDSTLSVINDVDDDRIKVITQENRGQGFARNAGLKVAKGKYVAFVDSDDTIERDMLFTMYKRGEKDLSDVVQCNLCDIYPDGRRVLQLETSDKTVKIADCGEYCDKYFSTCYHSYEVCNKLINRELLLKSGVRFKDTRKYFSEDLMFNLELLSYIKKISFINDAFYNYYQSNESHLHSSNEARLKASFDLFGDYIRNANEPMKSAATYTASMIILYNAGFCGDIKDALKRKELKGYICNALKRKCKIKHRIFLTAMMTMPVFVRERLVKMYSGRWNK